MRYKKGGGGEGEKKSNEKAKEKREVEKKSMCVCVRESESVLFSSPPITAINENEPNTQFMNKPNRHQEARLSGAELFW